MFGDRIRDIDSAIARHKDYKKSLRKIDKFFDNILEKYKDNRQIAFTFEDYSDAVYCSVYAYEKLLYKYGVMDGIRLVIDGLKDVDIENI